MEPSCPRGRYGDLQPLAFGVAKQAGQLILLASSPPPPVLQLSLLKQRPGTPGPHTGGQVLTCGLTLNTVHGLHDGGTEAPACAVGETIVITTGTSKAPSPSRRIALRLDIPACACGRTTRSRNRSALPSLSRANQTASSLTGVFHSFCIRVAISEADVLPSQWFQMNADVLLRQ